MCLFCVNCGACGKPVPEMDAFRASDMPCPKCGALVPHGEAFCPECGTLMFLKPGQAEEPPAGGSSRAVAASPGAIADS